MLLYLACMQTCYLSISVCLRNAIANYALIIRDSFATDEDSPEEQDKLNEPEITNKPPATCRTP